MLMQTIKIELLEAHDGAYKCNMRCSERTFDKGIIRALETERRVARVQLEALVDDDGVGVVDGGDGAGCR